MLSAPISPDLPPLSDAETAELRGLLNEGSTATDRRRARDLARRASLLALAQVVAAQQLDLSTDQSAGALDSELATLHYSVPAARWTGNPLAGGLDFDQPRRPLMVARLDAADPQQVRDLIADSLLTEKQGLAGKIVIDSRGLQMPGAGGRPDGYAPFDEQLRRLAALLRQRATLDVVHDDQPDILTDGPSGKAVRDVAIYVGWYRLRDYEPAFDFARGAVGYHVASLEMMSLSNAEEPGWVTGLLRDGVVATCGATAEPYLSAFPPPIAFFPLLLTGELTLAEVYWVTLPQVSWRLGLVGDPLYRPFAADPALTVDDLPDDLRRLVEQTRPRE
jgi:uncharacterized protein (TIGR03790 family)